MNKYVVILNTASGIVRANVEALSADSAIDFALSATDDLVIAVSVKEAI